MKYMLVDPLKSGADISSKIPWLKLGLKDMDAMFYSNEEAQIVNNIDIETPDFKNQINRAIFKENRIENIGFVAECPCGFVRKNMYEGTTCPKCNGLVASAFTYEFRHNTWLTVPDGIPAFIHPAIYMVLTDWLKRGRSQALNCLDDLLNPEPKGKIDPDVDSYFDGRGFKYFYDNFDMVMDFFYHIHPKSSKHASTPFIKRFIDTYRDEVFCTKLPMLAKELHPISNHGKSKKFKDAASNDLSEAIIDLASIKFLKDVTVTKHNKIESITFNAYKSYMDYSKKVIKDKLSTKYGLLISHAFGSRLHMSTRGVIRPITMVHNGDEIHYSWKIGLNSYKHMILNLLINRKGYNPFDAVKKFEKAFVRYDWDIDQIFQTLIKEAKGEFLGPDDKKWRVQSLPGLPIYFSRNPGLNPGSVQLLFVTRIGPMLKKRPEDESKVDISENTIGISTMVIKRPNGDFDGDEMNGLPIIEMKYLGELIRAFHPMGQMIENDTKLTVTTNTAWINTSELLLLNGFLNDEDYVK